MRTEDFVNMLDTDFYTGVPDSLLKNFCNYLINVYGTEPKHHIIAANEGNAVAIASGYYLATGKIPVVYLQNSGQGNIINPITSLMNDKIYGIPCIFVIGWRGEPGCPDEPQHQFQGEITLALLEILGISYCVIDNGIDKQQLSQKMVDYKTLLKKGKQVAFIIRNGALQYDSKVKYANSYSFCREEIIKHIVKTTRNDVIISTTGKTSRELFEIRENIDKNHANDFLTVGSMGHSSSVALGIALQKPNEKIWIIDGDGALLMHMGAMALIGAIAPNNLVHILINNNAHESVGGMPTVADKIDFVKIASACGYEKSICVKTLEEFNEALISAKQDKCLCFIEIKCAIGARDNLGRPTATPEENKLELMKHLGVKI